MPFRHLIRRIEENRDHCLGANESFIISQFQSLMGHIDTLISSSTMRVYSFLLVWTLSGSVVSIVISSSTVDAEAKAQLAILVCGFLFVIGSYFYWQQLTSSIRIVYYYRILNRIRARYKKTCPGLDVILSGIPFSEDEPRSILGIFDPGIWLFPILNSIASFIALRMLLKDTACSILIALAVFAIEIAVWLVRQNRKLRLPS